MKNDFEIERVESELVQSNTYVVSQGDDCVIIDAGAKWEELEEHLHGKNVRAILLTHGHYDHCFFLKEYLEHFDCPVYASKHICEYLKNPDYNYSNGNFLFDDFAKFKFLSGKGKIEFGDICIEYQQLGGHSKSDMCYQIGDDIFVGDVLIGRDMGRIDLYGGDKNAMKRSLQFLVALDYHTMHCGHGAEVAKAVEDKVAKLWIKFLSR